MTDILVTGANGFIGRKLIENLRHSDYSVYGAGSSNGDISLPETWEQFPATSVLVHLAAKSFVPDSWKDPVAYLQNNCLGTSYALEYCKRNRSKLVFLSSYMYGDPLSLPISEDAPVYVNNPYALSKSLAEQVCRFYSENFGVQSYVLRPFNVYGHGQGESFLIPTIVSQVRAGNVIRVADLRPRRDFVYIKDLVNAITSTISYNGKCHIFNIGSGVSYSVEELIQMVQSILNTSFAVINADVRRPGEIMDTVANISAAKAELGWVPKFNLKDGLIDMLSQS